MPVNNSASFNGRIVRGASGVSQDTPGSVPLAPLLLRIDLNTLLNQWYDSASLSRWYVRTVSNTRLLTGYRGLVDDPETPNEFVPPLSVLFANTAGVDLFDVSDGASIQNVQFDLLLANPTGKFRFNMFSTDGTNIDVGAVTDDEGPLENIVSVGDEVQFEVDVQSLIADTTFGRISINVRKNGDIVGTFMIDELSTFEDPQREGVFRSSIGLELSNALFTNNIRLDITYDA